MEELELTRLWMGGVVGMMLVFAIVALAGYLTRRRRENIQTVSKQEERNG